MHVWKKMLAAFLAMVLLASTVTVSASPGTSDPPEELPQITPMSLQPLKEYWATLDLTGYLPGELETFPVSEVIRKLNEKEDVTWSGNEYTISKDAEIYYATGYSTSSIEDDYTTITDQNNATMDLRPEYASYDSVGLELVVGSGGQLNPDNVRIMVTVSVTPMEELLDFTIYKPQDTGSRTQVDVFDTYYSERSSQYQIGTDPQDWSYGEPVYLSMKLNTDIDATNVTATVYRGLYTAEEEIPQGAETITDIWNQPNMAVSGGHFADYSYNSEDWTEMTVVLQRNGKTVFVLPMVPYLYESGMSLGYSTVLYVDEGGTRISVDESWGYDGNDYDAHVVTLAPGYPANGIYYYGLTLHNPDPNAGDGGTSGINFVEKAVVGRYETLEAAIGETDIKTQLFSNPYSDGYGADYSNGVTFTVFTTTGEVLYFSLRTEASSGGVLPSEPRPLSADTYFRMQSAYQTANSSSSRYDAYIMPYDDDSYYYNGYQTIFLLDNNTGIENGTTIYPVFYTGSSVDAFAGTDVNGQTASAQKQTTGETGITFQNGEAIAYSAAAENGRHLKNYWVTFVTKKTGGPALFVNGTNYDGHYDENGTPVREVFLTEDYGYHHDIFFANIGDEEMTGLTVTLSPDAQNIALDDYWTIGEAKSLAAFTSTVETTQYGELSNVAKIRLVPATDGNGDPLSGEISGTLTIKADGIDPVTIILKGTAGLPEITTDEIVDGVLYVPYSSVIQTNNMYEADAVEFTTASGRLPDGVRLRTSGEIYGVPRESGSFTFTVSATYEGTPMEPKTFTLEIASNTNEAVWNYDATVGGDSDYQISVAIPNEDGSVSAPAGTVVSTENNDWNNVEQIFESEGTFAYFENLWLDGVPLTADIDYTAREGSTRITIRTQTLQRSGNGVHTIAAEFRDDSGILRRAAQNYEISSSTSDSSGSSGGGSSGSTSHSITTEPTTCGTITVSRDSAISGNTVTVTVTPDAGYMLDELIVTDRNGRRITVTQTRENQYTFQMPGSGVTIEAVFTVRAVDDPVPGLPFIDVDVSDWFASYVTDMYERGLMNGTSATTFSPAVTTSRGMMVTILHNLEGRPATEGTYFSDVALNQYYTNAASWAAENGIVSGYGNGQFGPNDPITREQMVMILMRYSAYKGIDTSRRADLSQFTDSAQISAEATEAMSWAYAEGLINGKGNGILDPQGQSTRAEVAAIVSRFCQKFVNGEGGGL